MSKKQSPSISDARDLLDHVNLEGIEVYELVARGIRRDNAEGHEDVVKIQAQAMNVDSTLRTRFTLTYSAVSADYKVDLAARYALTQPLQLKDEVISEFVERVGIMAAYPYLREHLFNLASRLGEPMPVLGILRQGDFRLQSEESEPAP